MYKLCVSLRYLRSKKVNLFSIAGVALGVMALIIVMSVMGGFSRELRSRIRGTLSDIIIQKANVYGFTGYRKVEAKVMTVKHVAACSPHMQGLMMIELRNRYLKYGFFIGVEPKLETQASDFEKYLMSGTKPSDLGRGNETPPLVIAGNELLKIGPERKILVVSPTKGLRELVKTELTEEGHLVETASSIGKAISKIRRCTYEVKSDTTNRYSSISTTILAPYVQKQKGKRKGNEYDLVIAEYKHQSDNELQRLYDQLMRSSTDGRRRPLVLLLPDGIERSSIDISKEINVECMKLPSDGDLFHEDIEKLFPGLDIRVDVGETLDITTHSRALEPTLRRVKVAGIFKAGVYDFDSHNLYMHLKTAQSLRGNRAAVTSLNVRLDDYKHWPEVVTAIKEKLGPSFIVTTWEDERKNFLTAVALERKVMAVILFCIILVAGFMILGFLTMIVAEKTKDIGTLKALGATMRGILSIFLLDGLLIGIIGSLIGGLLGIGITLRLNWIADRIYDLTRFRVFPRDIYYLDKIPTELNPVTITIVVACAICVSVIFSIYPALKAAHLDPVEALRYE